MSTKYLSAALLLIAATTLTSNAQSSDPGTVLLIPVPNPELICRLHPVIDDVGTFIPPPSDISDVLTVKSSTMNVSFIDDDMAEPWPQAAKDAFNYATAIWENHLDSPVDIEIDAHWSNLGGCDLMQGVTLGAAGPTFVASWGSSPVANTTYPIGLVNAIIGSDQAPGSADVNSSFNKDCDDVATDLWYFGTDGNVPSGQIDFISVVLHELGHGLGFSGSASYDDGINDTGGGGTNGNECNGTAGGGCFSSTPNIYDRFAFDATTAGDALLDVATYPNNSVLLGSALTGSVAHFASPSVEANNGGEAAPLFGPDPWESGSSYSHLDETSYNGSPHALMTPYLSSQEANHSPGALTCAIFQDIGWSAGPDCLTLLPVELGAFGATVKGKIVSLQWETLSEHNNAGFEVEMLSKGGAFERAGFVAGAGTTTEQQHYQYRFAVAAAGQYTFRLKQIDFDGGFVFSETVSTTVGLEHAYELSPAYPNPFNPVTQFSLVVAAEQTVRIRVLDMTGRIVQNIHSGTLTPNQQHTFIFEASDLPTGMYWIQITGETFKANHPTVLQK